MIATGNPAGKDLWAAIEEEFLRFHPQHTELLEARQEAYFTVLAKGPSDIGGKLATAMAGYFGNSAHADQWASNGFAEALAIFLVLVESESARLQ